MKDREQRNKTGQKGKRNERISGRKEKSEMWDNEAKKKSNTSLQERDLKWTGSNLVWNSRGRISSYKQTDECLKNKGPSRLFHYDLVFFVHFGRLVSFSCQQNEMKLQPRFHTLHWLTSLIIWCLVKGWFTLTLSFITQVNQHKKRIKIWSITLKLISGISFFPIILNYICYREINFRMPPKINILFLTLYISHLNFLSDRKIKVCTCTVYSWCPIRLSHSGQFKRFKRDIVFFYSSRSFTLWKFGA